MNWTKAERMKIAMMRGKPDRLPVMPQVALQHGIQYTEPNYRSGIAAAYENPEMFLERTIQTAKIFDYDGVRLGLPPAPVRIKDEDGILVAYDLNIEKRIGIIDMAGGANILPDHPQNIISNKDDIKRTPRPRADELLTSSPYQMLKKSVEEARKNGFFIVSWAPPLSINYLIARRGQEQGLIDLFEHKELAEWIMDLGLEIAIETSRAITKCGVNALNLGDAYCSCSVISPSIFEEFCLPRFRMFCDEIHKEDVLIYLHICGKSSSILEMMADTGVDCIEPLDPLGDVEVADAKRRVGGRVSLMGGVSTLTLLNGKPEEVEAEALKCCQDGGENGGYILAAGDMVPNYTPPENLHALVRAAKKHIYNQTKQKGESAPVSGTKNGREAEGRPLRRWHL